MSVNQKSIKSKIQGPIHCQLYCIYQSDRLSVKCYDTRQENGKLPPPFIFGEGIKGDNSKNASCLDYKIR